eukprot:CAMPEP_0198138546 /NCGR_PEP_ID=MMETSP1443-20131203/1935_1 /TAXON_ID=186043 /ORGANISM="Entomoneis sp., Strain CCMP2396" /LENGTH=62 /DNA_ID=CAMNT_0043800351 /DNA_START=108 /DNA_END=293 /DNA_ORIENTATION=-
MDQVNEDNHPSFQYVGLNKMGQRTFLRDVPILLLPHLFEHSPMRRFWLAHGRDYAQTNSSTR